VLWTAAALKAARLAWRSSDGRRFHHVTTDEIHGALAADAPAVIETRPLAPNSPCAAFKAGSNHVVRAYHRTYGLPVAIGNSSNNYGPRQHAEKFGPTVIAACRRLTPIPTYGDGSNRLNWMYVADHCRPPNALLRSGRTPTMSARARRCRTWIWPGGSAPCSIRSVRSMPRTIA
jgi:dTDP-glucose 4,6-dehydratase